MEPLRDVASQFVDTGIQQQQDIREEVKQIKRCFDAGQPENAYRSLSALQKAVATMSTQVIDDRLVFEIVDVLKKAPDLMTNVLLDVREMFLHLARIKPNDHVVFREAGFAFLREDVIEPVIEADYEQAVKLLQQALFFARARESHIVLPLAEAHYKKGNCTQEEYEAAVQLLEEQRVSDEKNPYIYFLLGKVLAEGHNGGWGKEFVKAKLSLKTTIRLCRELRQQLEGSTKELHEIKQLQVEAQLQMARLHESGSERSFFEGRIRRIAPNISKAREHVKRSFEVMETDRAYLQLALLHFKSDEDKSYKKAARYFEKTLSLLPEDANGIRRDVYLKLARLYRSGGNGLKKDQGKAEEYHKNAALYDPHVHVESETNSMISRVKNLLLQ